MIPYHHPASTTYSETTRSIFSPKDYLPPPHTAASRKKAKSTWYHANVTALVEVCLPDERNRASQGAFQAVQYAAVNTAEDGHLVVQANGSLGAVPDYPSLVQTVTDWYHAAAQGNPNLRTTGLPHNDDSFAHTHYPLCCTAHYPLWLALDARKGSRWASPLVPRVTGTGLGACWPVVIPPNSRCGGYLWST